MTGAVTCTIQRVGTQEFKAKQKEMERKSAHVITGTGRSRYSDCATGLGVPGFESGRSKRYFSSPKYPDLLKDPPSFLFNGY
jgi:hypothetical protein